MIITIAASKGTESNLAWKETSPRILTHTIVCTVVIRRLQHLQSELEANLQRTSAHAQSLQANLASVQKEREQLQSELQQARSALESRASEAEYMQSEASSLQQALHKQAQETQQAQQACDGWMSNARQQVVRGLSNLYIGAASTAKIPDECLSDNVWLHKLDVILCP